MLPYRDSKITRAVLIVFFLLVVGYAYFEAQGFLFGPAVSITSSATEVHDPFVTIQGHAERISSLSMNGKQITVTENGSFSEPYLLAAGDNRIVFDASDKYGRSRKDIVEIVYISTTTPSTNSPEMAATSTESTSTSPLAQ